MNPSKRKSKNNFADARYAEVKSNLVFGHYTLGEGNICVALLRPPKGSDSTEYVAAVAFGHPSDSPNRKKARAIASGRLLCNKENRNFKFMTPSKDMAVIFQAALEAATTKMVVRKHANGSNYTTLYAPNWVVDEKRLHGTPYQKA